MRVLIGHHDVATAFVHKGTRYWIESHPLPGQRFCVLGPNAKRPRNNSYSAVVAMYLDHDGNVCSAFLHPGAEAAKVDAFETRFSHAKNDPVFAAAIDILRKFPVRVTYIGTTIIGGPGARSGTDGGAT